MAISYRGQSTQGQDDNSFRIEPVVTYDYSAYDPETGEGAVESVVYWMVPGAYNISSSVEYDKDTNQSYSQSYFYIPPTNITGSFYGRFYGDVEGTASYSTSASYAVSASWAPGGGATFPYIGDAVITGSLVVSGSGVSGIDTIQGFLIAEDGNPSVAFFSQRTLENAAGAALDWQNYTQYDNAGYPSIDWTSRFLLDSVGNRSHAYDTRTLIYPNGTSTAINYGTQDRISMSGSVVVTGSLTVSGSSTLRSIGPTELTGSLGILGNSTINGNVTINGTASISYLNVQYETASIIYSSGSNQFGDASNDTQTLYGTVTIPTGSLSLSGSVFVSSSNFVRFNHTGSGTNTNYSDLSVIRYSTYDTPALKLIRPDGIGFTLYRQGSTNGFWVGDEGGNRNMTLYSNAIGAFTFVAPGSGGDFSFTGGDATTPAYASSIVFKTNDYTINSATSSDHSVKIQGPNVTGSNPYNLVSFQVGSGFAEKAAIRYDGGAYFSSSVGIGITTPSASLHISSSGANLLRIDSPTLSNIVNISGSGHIGIGTTPAAGIRLDIAGGHARIASSYGLYANTIYSAVASNTFLSLNGTTSAALGLHNANMPFTIGVTTGAEIMRISGSGNVGIGTTTPAFRLDVSGSSRFTGNQTITGSLYTVAPNNTPTVGQFTGAIDGYLEFSLRNTSASVSASSDIAVYADNGTATSNYIDMGINSSVHVGSLYDSIYLGRANDAYLFNDGGHLFIGNANNTTASGSLFLFAHPNGGSTGFGITITGSLVGINKTGSLGASLDVSGSTIIGGTLSIATSSIGPNENTLTLGARDAINEGGQVGFNAPGGTYTSASFIDLYQNRLRVLRGTNAGSDAEVASWNMHTKQVAFQAYNSATAFTGTAVAGLGVDSGGNIITTQPPATIYVAHGNGTTAANSLSYMCYLGGTPVSIAATTNAFGSAANAFMPGYPMAAAGTASGLIINMRTTGSALSAYRYYISNFNTSTTGSVVTMAAGHAAGVYSGSVGQVTFNQGDALFFMISSTFVAGASPSAQLTTATFRYTTN